MSTPILRVSGNEQADKGSALEALVAFYRAFNAGDLDALGANWAPNERPSMDNPIGGIRRGWPAIRAGYQALFEGPARVQVAFHDFTSEGGDDWHLFVGREEGTCVLPDRTIPLRIRTTRWFAKIDGVWRQLHHHGSIEEPALLADYQRAILGAPIGNTMV